MCYILRWMITKVLEKRGLFPEWGQIDKTFWHPTDRCASASCMIWVVWGIVILRKLFLSSFYWLAMPPWSVLHISSRRTEAPQRRQMLEHSRSSGVSRPMKTPGIEEANLKKKRWKLWNEDLDMENPGIKNKIPLDSAFTMHIKVVIVYNLNYNDIW